MAARHVLCLAFVGLGCVVYHRIAAALSRRRSIQSEQLRAGAAARGLLADPRLDPGAEDDDVLRPLLCVPRVGPAVYGDNCEGALAGTGERRGPMEALVLLVADPRGDPSTLKIAVHYGFTATVANGQVHHHECDAVMQYVAHHVRWLQRRPWIRASG
jgi:hypothetical protein